MRSLIIWIFLFSSALIASAAFGQINAAGETPQYLFSSFSKGKVLLKGNKVQETVMNYNTVTGCMVFEQNGKLFDLTNLHTIDTIYLQDFRFIPVEKAFYEVVATAPIPLFIQHKGELLPPGKPAGYGGTSEVSATTRLSSVELSSGHYNLQLPSDFKVKITPVYWFMRDGIMVSFLNERQLLKLFPDKGDEIKVFIKKGKLKLERKEDLVKIIRFCVGFTQ